jgi:hypothetical protein
MMSDEIRIQLEQGHNPFRFIPKD